MSCIISSEVVQVKSFLCLYSRRSQSCKDGPNNIDTSEFLLTEPVEEEDTDLQQASRQLLAVQEAFAADDVVDEFMTEKKKLEDESKPKLVDLTLPGTVCDDCVVVSTTTV